MNHRFSGLLVASSLAAALAASAGTLPSLPSAFNASTGYAETVGGVATYSVDLERRGFSIFFR